MKQMGYGSDGTHKPKIALVLHARPEPRGSMEHGDDEPADAGQIEQSKLDAADAILKSIEAKDAKALCAALDTLHSLQHAEWGDDRYMGGTSADGSEGGEEP